MPCLYLQLIILIFVVEGLFFGALGLKSHLGLLAGGPLLEKPSLGKQRFDVVLLSCGLPHRLLVPASHAPQVPGLVGRCHAPLSYRPLWSSAEQPSRVFKADLAATLDRDRSTTDGSLQPW